MDPFKGILFFLSAFISISAVQAQYDDKRCICVCPEPSVVNATKSNRMIYKQSVPPSKCDCDNVVLPNLHVDIKGREKEFCPRCDCKYESRNTTTIKVVVILVTWVISLLVLYMCFLLCLEPLLNKRRGHAAIYQHQTNEEDLPPTEAGQCHNLTDQTTNSRQSFPLNDQSPTTTTSSSSFNGIPPKDFINQANGVGATSSPLQSHDGVNNSAGPPHPLRVRPHNMLGRVGHQQDKWKRQVQEQRRNIYDRHTMLN